jgi:hypothetical protein
VLSRSFLWKNTTTIEEWSVMSSILASSTLKLLADKLYEKRKAAALEVEQAAKALAAAGDISGVVRRAGLARGRDLTLGAGRHHRPPRGRVFALAAGEPPKGGPVASSTRST